MSQLTLRTFFFFGIFGLVLPLLEAAESSVDGSDLATDVPIALRQTPMPDIYSGRLGEILKQYYSKGLGGSEVWDQIRSVRVSGRLKLDGGEFDIDAYQKKPHYIRMTIHGSQRDIRMGYDGHVAWINKGEEGTERLGEDSERRCIHGAHFGSYLLYPYAEGKKIVYVDTVPVDGTICHHIRVTLNTEFQVDYYIDMRTNLEVKVIDTDLRTGSVCSAVYSDYTYESGMPIAQKVVREEDGVWISTFELDEVRVNSGVMPWMFKMPE